MSGAIQNTEQIETGPSISFGAGLLFGYQITRITWRKHPRCSEIESAGRFTKFLPET